MKWIGQQVYDQVSRFRKDVYLEGTSLYAGDGTGTLALVAGDLTMYNAVNDGNPTISLGSSATERLEIKAEYESGAQGLDAVRFTSFTAGSSANDARYAFEVDDVFLFSILDDGIQIKASGNLNIGSSNTILSDNSGTTTLSNIDALDATTESTIESAIDTLANLTSITLDSVTITSMQSSSESFADNDTSLMTSAAIDDAILKGGSSTTIKILPHNFMSNEDGGVNKSEQYDDDNFGVKTTHHNAELFAFVDIPIGKTATSVVIYGSDTNNAVDVFEADIDAGALADKTPGGGCTVGSACDITDVVADATNYLVIRVTTTNSTGDIVYGGAVTISG